MDETHLVEADHVSRSHHGNVWYGLQSDKYKWYHLRHQTPDEVLLFKIFDSKTDIAATCTSQDSLLQTEAEYSLWSPYSWLI
jgi:hypothetical protein